MNATLPAIPRWVAIAGLAALLLYFAATGIVGPLRSPYAWSDFATFYSAAQAFDDGGDPYALLELRGGAPEQFTGWVGRYFYPPPFAAVVVQPLRALPFDIARRVWVCIEALAYLLAGVVLARLLFGDVRASSLLAVGAVLLPFAPMRLDLRLGSVSAVLLLLISCFLLERQRGHATRAAVCLAAAIVLKLTPALVAAYLLVHGDRRLFVRTAVCTVLFVVVALPWTGVQSYRTYALETLPFLATANFSWFTNQSVDAFFWRLFVPNPDTVAWIDSPTLYRVCTFLVGALILATLFRMARRDRQSVGSSGLAWGLASTLCGSVMLARVSWEYMLVLTLPGFVLALREALRGTLGRGTVIALGMAYALCALPIPYTGFAWDAGAAVLLLAPRLYGMVLLFVVMVRLQRRNAVTSVVGRGVVS